MSTAKKFQYLPHIAFSFFLLIYLAPLLHFKTHLGGIFSDPIAHAAQMPWFCENYFSGTFHQPNLYAPIGVNMANSYDMPLLQSLTCLAYPLGAVGMFNLLAAVQVILIMLTSYYVGSKYLNNHWLIWSFVFLFGFSSFTISRAYQHINILSTIWGVAITYLVFDKVNTARLKDMLKAFFLLTLVYLSAWQNIANVTFIAGFFMVNKLIKNPEKIKSVKNTLFSIVVVAPLFIAGTYPIIKANDNAVYESGHQPTRHADIATYFIPLKQQVFSKVVPPSWQTRLDFERISPLDPLVITLTLYIIVISIKKRELYRPEMLGLAGIYLILSFGQYISLMNDDLIHLPWYRPLSTLPPIMATRVPARFAVVVIFILTLYVLRFVDKNHSMWSIKNTPKKIGLYAIVATTIASGNLQYKTFDFSNIIPYQGIEVIKNDSSKTKVLHLPTRVDQPQNYMQYLHGKPITSGYISYRSHTNAINSRLDDDPFYAVLDCDSTTEQKEAILKPNYYDFFLESLINEDIGYIIVNEYLLTNPTCKELADFVAEYIDTFTKPRLDVTRTYTVYKTSLPSTKELN